MSVRPDRTPPIEAFWREAVAATPELDLVSEFTIFSFGDSQDLCDHVLAETRAGRNRATASLRWAYESRLPKVGAIAIATDWAGAPRAVLVTRRVDIVPYDEVDEDFALAEGYVADPLNEWREVHWAFFCRRCAELGRVASLDMPIVCERFELVYPRCG
ncbi:MAG TPA: ASCH domain-containing protein [Dongiaceae bacterium]